MTCRGVSISWRAACRARTNSRFFFFQAEDGIRDKLVTGVQTCALPISCWPAEPGGPARPWGPGGPGGPGNPSGPGGPTAPSVTWKGREWTCPEPGTGSGGMTTGQYEPRATPGGSVPTVLASLNVRTRAGTIPTLPGG